MLTKVLGVTVILLMYSGVAMATPLSKVGVFVIEANQEQAVPTIDQVRHDSVPRFQSALARFKTRAEKWVRQKATYLNTHPIVGNPDLPPEYHSILPHEVFSKMKEAFVRELREKSASKTDRDLAAER